MHSDFFALERGVRQGDPLSPYLFIAAVEILAIVIRTNNNIRGISIGDQEYKLVQYADDTTGILKDEESLKVFLDVLKSYEKVSGLKINISMRMRTLTASKQTGENENSVIYTFLESAPNPKYLHV